MALGAVPGARFRRALTQLRGSVLLKRFSCDPPALTPPASPYSERGCTTHTTITLTK